MMTIRKIKPTEYHIFSDFLYNAIFVPPGMEAPPREIINKPEIAIYIDNFGNKNDFGVVAVQDTTPGTGGKIVGAAWTRIIKAFGHVDDETPELAISVLPEYRGNGIGTKLLKSLFEQLAVKGYKQTSLSVQKENPALRLYRRMGYKIVLENDEYYILALDLK